MSKNETKQENKTDGNIKNMDLEGWLFLDTSLIVAQRKSAVLHNCFKTVQTWNLPNDPKAMQMEGNTAYQSCQPTGMEGILLSIAYANGTGERKTILFTEDSLLLIKSAED